MLKNFFILIILSLLSQCHKGSFINYQYVGKDQKSINSITSAFEINNNTIGIISDNKHIYTCNNSENRRCDLLQSSDNNLFVVDNYEIFTSISNKNLTYYDKSNMKQSDSYLLDFGEITAAAYLKPNTLITASYKENTMNLNTLKKTWVGNNTINITGHSLDVSSLLQLSNGMLVSGSEDHTIRIWDPNNNYSLVATLNDTRHVTSLLQLSNGMLVSGSVDSPIKIWDANKYTLVTTLNETNTVFSLLQLSNGMLVSGGFDTAIRIWDPNNNYSLVTTLRGHTSTIWSLLQLSNGMLVSGSMDGTIYIWNPNDNYTLVTSLRDDRSYPESLLQLSNGMLVSGTHDGTIKIWDTNNNYSLITTLSGHEQAVISLIQLSNGMLVSGSRDNTIKIWDPKINYFLLNTLTGHESYVSSLLQLSNGMLVSGGHDTIIKIWNLSKEIYMNSTKVVNPQKINKLMTFDGKTILSFCSESICKYKYNQDNSTIEIQNCRNFTDNLTTLLKLDEQKFMSFHSNGTIFYWDVDKLDTNRNEEVSDLITIRDTKQPLYITQIMKTDSEELMAILNTNNFVVLNKFNLDVLFKDDHSTSSNIVSIIGVSKDQISLVSSDGLVYSYMYKPNLFLSKKKLSTDFFNFFYALRPIEREMGYAVKIENIPKCLKLMKEGREIKNNERVNCGDDINYELSLPCEKTDFLKISTTDNSYEVTINAQDPPTYSSNEIDVIKGISEIEIFKTLPLNDNIKSIIFKELNSGYIQYKRNDKYLDVLIDMEYDANLNFVYIMNLETTANVTIPFILKDIYGISSDLITLKVTVNEVTHWYKGWFVITIFTIGIISAVLFCLYICCHKYNQENTEYFVSKFKVKLRCCYAWLKNKLCCCCNAKDNESLLI
jgi:WD40 repeat protein